LAEGVRRGGRPDQAHEVLQAPDAADDRFELAAGEALGQVLAEGAREGQGGGLHERMGAIMTLQLTRARSISTAVSHPSARS
jgi:hypothetical protein